MGKGVVCPFFSNYLFATSRCIEKEAVDKMIAHFVTAPFAFMRKTSLSGLNNFAEIGNPADKLCNCLKQSQAIVFNFFLLIHNHYGSKESVDRRG